MLIKSGIGFLTVILFSIIAVPPAHALWWMAYHKPAFKGKIIDSETKEPIEGAVVVVTYSKKSIGIAESYSVVVNVRETLTDKNGEFYFPSYTTIIQPLSWNPSWQGVDVIIFKSGYGSFPDWRVSPPKGIDIKVVWDDFFTGEVGVEKEVWWREPWKVGSESKKIKVTFGLVELPKLKTREERRKASRVGVTGYRSKDLPLLYKALNEEQRYLGIPESE